MQPQSHLFKEKTREAVQDRRLDKALNNLRIGTPEKRLKAVSRLAEFETLREEGRQIKNHTLAHLDLYLEQFEQKVTEAGGQVHWAPTGQDACEIIQGICDQYQAQMITKGKSMISEEVGLNDFLEGQSYKIVETDLGEYIIQLRGEKPSHIIAPAIHLTKEDVADTFRAAHTDLDPERELNDAAILRDEARAKLRDIYFQADVGITGGNFAIAETGTTVIVTNEGNGDLTQIIPKVHIVLTSIDKIVPTLEDSMTLMRLLARSGTGQEISTYTTFSTGPKREGDLDGPEAYHVVLLDNGRSKMLGTEFQDMLRCIRCSACMNHCPVYCSVGGHSYGWVYPGPMGSVLTPSLIGIDQAGHLPNASTFCGKCESVCPMKIPLPKMMRHWREREFERHLTPKISRFALRLWVFMAKHPKIYHRLTSIGRWFISIFSGQSGKKRTLLFGMRHGLSGWLVHRDLPTPQGSTFQAAYRQRQAEQQRKAG